MLKKFLSLTLAVAILLSLFSMPAVAGGDGIYDINIDGTEAYLGAADLGGGYTEDVYLINVPADTTAITFASTSMQISEIYSFVWDDYTGASSIILNSSNALDYNGLAEMGFGLETIYNALPAGTYYGFLIFDDNYTGTWFFVGVEGSGGGSGVDKTALQAVIDSAPTSSDCFDSGDRYNGKITSVSGFWAEYQAALITAISVNNSPNATEEAVDNALADLTAAIEKLIPRTQINPTALYELIDECNKTYSENQNEPRDPANPSWYKVWLGEFTESGAVSYRIALAEAETALSGLFNADGTPNMDNNNAGNSQAIQDIVDALSSAKLNLLFPDDYNKARNYHDAILALDREFPYTEADASAFTEESWGDYTSARNAAKIHAQSYPTGGGMTGTQASGYTAALKNYWLACYNLIPAGGADVALRVTDTAGLADPAYALSSASFATYNETLTLDSVSGYTLKDLLTKAGITIPAETGEAPPTWLVYINGLVVRDPTYLPAATLLSVCLKDEDEYSKDIDWNDIKLKDGDDVQLIRIPQPQEYYYIHPINAYFAKLTSNYGQLRFADGGAKTAKEGQEISFAVERTSAYINNKDEVYIPRSGVELVLYGPKNPDGTWPNLPVRTGLVSDASGNVRLTLDKAGEYLVTAVDMRADDKNNYIYPRLQAPATPVTVTITSLNTAELNAARTHALSVIGGIMEGYGADKLGGKYSDGQTAYNSAKASVNSGASLADINAAVKLLSDTLAQLQTAAELPSFLKVFDNYLGILPSIEAIAAGKLAQADGQTVANIKDCYERGTPYQRSQLTTEQKAHYDAVMAAWGTDGSGLPENVSYTVTVKFEPQSLKDRTSTHLSCLYGIRAPGMVSINPGAAITPDEHMQFTVNSSTQTFDVKVSQYEISGSYRLSKIVIAGDGYYKEHLPSSSFLYIESKSGANPSRENLTVTIYGRDLTAAATLDQTKDDARAELTAAYGAYVKAEYSNEKWAALVGYYNAGLAAISAAQDAAAVSGAKSTAIGLMAAVEKLGLETSETVGKYGTVRVTVENNTYSGAAFRGLIVTAEIPLNDGTTMMTAILEALRRNGYGWTGTGGGAGENPTNITYLAGIKKGDSSLSEFDGGPQSGWMGTLNDWFTNEGFQSFRVNAGNSMFRLVDGDQIAVQYTTRGYGADLGGTWNSADTSLKSLQYNGGTLMPSFSGNVQNYVLNLGSGGNSVSFIPTAANKNYQVRTYLNAKTGDNWYRRGETISVKAGDIVYIGVGDNAWPSMNKQGAEAISYSGVWYTIKITDSNDEGSVIDMINALPEVTYAQYKSQTEQVALARSAYNTLTPEAKSRVGQDILKKLTDMETGIEKFKAVDNVKALLAAIPAVDKLTVADSSKVQAAYDAYSRLDNDQRKYITVGDVEKYSGAVEWLKRQGISTPGEIVGSEQEPGDEVTVSIPKVTAKDGFAAISVSASDMSKAIAEAKKNESGAIVIEPEVSGETKKSIVELPRAALSEMAAQTNAELRIILPTGSVTIPNDALSSLASQAGGSTVSVLVEVLDTEALTARQQENVGGGVVFDISILSNGRSITSFGGSGITVSLPYTLKEGEDASAVKVWYLSGSGELQRMDAVYNVKKGMATFTTTHLSYYVVGVEEPWINPFTDVTADMSIYDAVRFVSQKKLFSGMTDTLFGPDVAMSRAMLVTVLHRLDGKPKAEGQSTFGDVLKGEWYSEAVVWATQNNIIQGHDNGLFGINDAVTREQMVTILYRYAKFKGYDADASAELSAYSDTEDVSSWALQAMKWSVENNIIKGVTTTTLSPSGFSTRSQVALVLIRFVNNIAQEG